MHNDILALQRLPAIDDMEMGPHNALIDDATCTVCSVTCSVTADE